MKKILNWFFVNIFKLLDEQTNIQTLKSCFNYNIVPNYLGIVNPKIQSKKSLSSED